MLHGTFKGSRTGCLKNQQEARTSEIPDKPMFPGHALREKGLQRQKSVVPLFGSQEKKRAFPPADKPLINRWSTVDFVLPSVYIGFRLFVFLERR